MHTFLLAGSPFRHVLDFKDSSALAAYLYPRFTALVSEMHRLKSKPLPPSALFFSSASPCAYLNGFEFSSPDDFKTRVESMGRTYPLVCILGELGGINRDFSRSLLYVELHRAVGCTRLAYEMNSGQRLDVQESTGLRYVLRSSADAGDGEDDRAVCPLLGFPAISILYG